MCGENCGGCEHEEVICQSCAMPMCEKDMQGTNKDGSKNEEYCMYCFKDGEFTEPELTREKMIEAGSEFLVKEHKMSQEESEKIMKEITKDLKRWQKV